MLTNRSMPRSTVIPVLGYPGVGKAIDWLSDAFGFTLRWRVGDHQAKLNVGEGTIAITEDPAPRRSRPRPRGNDRNSVMVRIDDVDGHYQHAKERGARILEASPRRLSVRERQYTVEDLTVHVWTLSQSIADVLPEVWGGTSGRL